MIEGNASKIIHTYQLYSHKFTCGYLFPFNREINEGYNTLESIDKDYVRMVDDFFDPDFPGDRFDMKDLKPKKYYPFVYATSLRAGYWYWEPTIIEVTGYMFYDKGSHVSDKFRIEKLILRSDSYASYRKLGNRFKSLEIKHWLPVRDTSSKEQPIEIKPTFSGKLPDKIEIVITSDSLENEHCQENSKFRPYFVM